MEDDVRRTTGPGGFTRDLVRWSETLAAIARTGLGFTENLYERERFEEVLNVAADIKAAANEALGVAVDDLEAIETAREQDHFVQEWLESVGVGVPGYVTPKVAIGAVVGNDAGELLLVQRADSGIWLYPTGWADIGYSPAEVAVKEVAEETGIECEPQRVLAVIDGQRMGFSRFGMYMLAVPLHGDRRRAAAATRWSAPTSAGSGPTTCRRRRPGPSGGRRWRSRRSTARTSRPSTTPCARRSGGPELDVAAQLARQARVGSAVGSRSRRNRSTSATSSPGSTASASSCGGRLADVVGLVIADVVELVVDERLEPGDVLDEVLVVGDQGGDPGVVLGGCGRQRLGGRRGADQQARPLDERQGGLRRRHLGGVLRHGGPQRCGARRRPCVRASLEHADDPGRALVAASAGARSGRSARDRWPCRRSAPGGCAGRRRGGRRG